jgi:hypothetical protein
VKPYVKRYDQPAIRVRAGQLGGVMAAVREARRAEAADRDALTLCEWTRAHREDRCDCQDAGGLEVVEGRCANPEKDRFASRQEAALVHSRLPFWRRRQNLRPYQCPGTSHYHLGRRFRRAPQAWRRAA